MPTITRPKPQFNTEALARLMYWIGERERIREQKEAGKSKPWTDDRILKSYRFCNVRRMDDTVSDWLLKNWYEPYYDHKNIVLAAVMARQFNKVETLEKIGFPKIWNPKRIHKRLEQIEKTGKPIFNGAYIITGTLAKKMKKRLQVVDIVLSGFISKPFKMDRTSIENTWTSLMKYRGMGSFIAGQVVSDLRWAASGTWADKNTWASIGPGSQRGMNRLLDVKEINKRIPQKEFEFLLGHLIKEITKQYPKIASRLEAQDVQNCCCEFDKYSRVLEGSGRPKQLYRGG